MALIAPVRGAHDDRMQMNDAQRKHREWIAAGRPRCDHPELDKEYHLGAATGDYVCVVCGESGWGRDWPEQERQARDEAEHDSGRTPESSGK